MSTDEQEIAHMALRRAHEIRSQPVASRGNGQGFRRNELPELLAAGSRVTSIEEVPSAELRALEQSTGATPATWPHFPTFAFSPNKSHDNDDITTTIRSPLSSQEPRLARQHRQ